MLVHGRIAPEIGFGQFQESYRRTWSCFLDMDEGAGELDEALVERAVWPMAVCQPQFFENFVGLEKGALIKTMEKAEIMPIEGTIGKALDQGGDAGAFGAHNSSCKPSKA